MLDDALVVDAQAKCEKDMDDFREESADLSDGQKTDIIIKVVHTDIRRMWMGWKAVGRRGWLSSVVRFVKLSC